MIMRTRYIATCIVALVTCLLAVPLHAQELDKSTRKEVKSTSKALGKAGWQVFGTTKSIEDALTRHYQVLLQHAGNQPLESSGRSKNLNVAVRRCETDAKARYASMMGSQVEAHTETTIQNTTGSDTQSSSDFSAHSHTSTRQTIKGLTPTVVFYRTLSDGSYEARALYVVEAF